MNTVLFKSWHALVAAIVVAAFVVWSSLLPDGAADRDFQIVSGCAALLLLLVVLGYVLRKYVHKLGISPEFRMRVPIEKLERAETGLAEVRVQMAAGRLSGKRDILKRANAILREAGVRRVVKVRLEADDHGQAVLRALPTGPLGTVARWMRAHLYYGIAAAILVGMHGGLSLHSGMALMLNGLTVVVVVSGLIGIAMWITMPRLLTEAEHDLSIEKAHALRESLDRKIEAAYAQIDPTTRVIFEDADRSGENFSERAGAALKAAPARDEGDRSAQDLLALLGQRQGVRADWESLTKIRRRMNMWRVVHLPSALLLTCAIAAHVVSVLWY
ncbi:MAG: hypothetical protein ACI8QZ_003556 [Chlamydiales bacterium]|jgi:hypothetical protein